MPSRMTLRSSLLLLALFVPQAAFPEEVVKHVGQVTFRVDQSQAFPGGVMAVRLFARGALGAAYAILDGHRVPFSLAAGIPRALVPIPLNAAPAPATLGVEILTRRGRQRVPLPVTIAPRAYPARTVVLPEEKRPLLRQPSATRDGRQLLGLLRAETPVEPRRLAPPIKVVPGLGFGGEQTWVGGSPVESMTDAIWGEQHRGVDFEVPRGTAVMTPARGTVLFAGPLTLSGQTLVIDHGQGVVSALFHLSRIDVKTGDRVEPGDVVGLSGDTGVAPMPLLQWRTYLHGVAVDPAALQQLLN
jgi:murein DD-endopeptidase MepM/ murein hydrolase activator NlpD